MGNKKTLSWGNTVLGRHCPGETLSWGDIALGRHCPVETLPWGDIILGSMLSLSTYFSHCPYLMYTMSTNADTKYSPVIRNTDFTCPSRWSRTKQVELYILYLHCTSYQFVDVHTTVLVHTCLKIQLSNRVYHVLEDTVDFSMVMYILRSTYVYYVLRNICTYCMSQHD